MTSVISLVSSNKTLYIVAAVAILSILGWGYYEKTRADGYEAQIELLQEQVKSAKTIDEMNKQTATVNQQVLQAAIDAQNARFDDLAKRTEQQSQNVLTQLEKSQASTAAQYNRVTQSIASLKITSCEGMMEELVKFPHTNDVQWNTK